MKYNRVISTAVMFLLLGTTLPAFAQKEEEQRGGGKEQAPKSEPQRAQKAAPQHAEKAVPQHAQKAEPQHAQQAQPERAQTGGATTCREGAAAASQAAPQRAEKQQHNTQRRHNHSVRRNNSRNAHKRSSPPGSRHRRLPATVAAEGGNYGRISNANYTSHFGHDHSFHMGRPEMRGGYNRFQYGGYSFGYNQGWPVGWGYGDNFYVEYIDGAYYLCDLVSRRPDYPQHVLTIYPAHLRGRISPARAGRIAPREAV